MEEIQPIIYFIKVGAFLGFDIRHGSKAIT